MNALLVGSIEVITPNVCTTFTCGLSPHTRDLTSLQDYNITYPPMTRLSSELIPALQNTWRNSPRFFTASSWHKADSWPALNGCVSFFLIMSPVGFDFGESVHRIVDTLSKIYDRVLTACMLKIFKTAAVISLFSNQTIPWYFWG